MVTAIELNKDLRNNGIADIQHTSVRWLAESAESTGLPSKVADWLSIALSFLWANFETAIQELQRVFLPGGIFTSLLNTRLSKMNMLLAKIEAHRNTLCSKVKRVVFGPLGIVVVLTEQLCTSSYFEDVVNFGGRLKIEITLDRYFGVWRSVNGLRVQLGNEKLNILLGFIQKHIADLKVIEATYLTRAWSARCKGLLICS